MAAIADYAGGDAELDEQIRGMERDYFEFGNRNLSDEDEDDDDDGSDTGSDDDSDGFSVGTDASDLAMPGAGPAAAGAAAGPAVDVAERTLRQRARCRCKAGTCADDLDDGDVDMIRAVNASMQKTELDLLILGKILTVISRGATTSKSKTRIQTERKRTRCNYTHEGKSMECSYRSLF